MKKTTTFIMAFALAGSLAMAQEKAAKPASVPAAAAAPAEQSQPAADAVIIKAGPVTITRSEFEAAIKTLPDQYQSFALGQGKKQFAEEFLRLKLLSVEGMKNGLDKDADVIRQLGLVREQLVAQAQLNRLEKGVVISDADVKAAYDANKKDYEQVHARHILIAFKGSPAAQTGKKELTEDEAKAKAEDIRKKIAGGAKFEDLAKTESDDIGSAANGGDLGNFNHGQMVPEFEQAAFGLKPGEVSEVVRTQFGYHIIKVESHDLTPIDGVREKLSRDLHQKKVQEQLDKMKAEAKPEFNEAYFVPPAPPAAAPSPADNAATAKPVAGSSKPAAGSKAPKDAHPVGEKKP